MSSRSALVLVLLVASTVAAAKDPEGAKEARKELEQAVKLLGVKRYDEAVERLRKLVKDYPLDPAAEKAAALLKEHGVGDEFRVKLVERDTFRNRLKVKDADILARAEKTLEELRKEYRFVAKHYESHRLELVVYDSQARYRKAGGAVTATGHYSTVRADLKKGEIEGRVEWYLPPYAKTLKDRETSMQGALFHECTHYLNAIHFAGLLPAVLDEGLATHFASRLNTEYYQYYRITDREQLESDARNSLNWIAKYADFLEFIDAERGFGRGDDSVSRWYSLCYAVVDFFAEGEIGGRKVSRRELMRKLQELTAVAIENAGESAPARLKGRPLLEKLVAEFYAADLQAFHKELAARIQKEYKQR